MSALRVIEMLESNQTTKLLKVNAFSTVVAMPLGIYCPYSNSTFNNWDRYGLLICPWIWVAGSITRLSFTQQQEQYVMTDWVIFYTCLFCPFYLLRNTLLPSLGYGGVAQVHHAEVPDLLAKVFGMLLELKRLSDIRHCLGHGITTGVVNGAGPLLVVRPISAFR